MTDSKLEVAFAELGCIHRNADRMLAGEISRTGWGLQETRMQAEDFLRLRSSLAQVRPDVYGKLPQLSYSFSISNQESVLRHIRSEIERLFSIGSALGLCTPLPVAPPRPLSMISPVADAKRGQWLVRAERVVIGLIVAYLVYVLGWNR